MYNYFFLYKLSMKYVRVLEQYFEHRDSLNRILKIL